MDKWLLYFSQFGRSAWQWFIMQYLILWWILYYHLKWFLPCHLSRKYSMAKYYSYRLLRSEWPFLISLMYWHTWGQLFIIMDKLTRVLLVSWPSSWTAFLAHAFSALSFYSLMVVWQERLRSPVFQFSENMQKQVQEIYLCMNNEYKLLEQHDNSNETIYLSIHSLHCFDGIISVFEVNETIVLHLLCSLNFTKFTKFFLQDIFSDLWC